MPEAAELGRTVRIDPAAVDDSAAVVRLREAVRLQKQAVVRTPNPSLKERTAHLQALIGMMAANRHKVRAALLSSRMSSRWQA